MNGIKWIVGAAFVALAAVTAYAQLPGITRKAVVLATYVHEKGKPVTTMVK